MPSSTAGERPAPPSPARWLPVAYFAVAHLALALAFAALAAEPGLLAGFFYQPRMLAVVHLVTLGWITSAILGSFYLVGLMALRLPLATTRLDVAAFACHVLGVSGLVAHFWLDTPVGMAWSAATIVVGIALFVLRVGRGLAGAPVPAELRAHIGLAFLNLLLAGVAGVLVGANKVHPLLPGPALAHVAAHAHLALVGFALTLAIGVAYRLLPMILPSAMPPPRAVWASAALLGSGAWGLWLGLATSRRPTVVVAAVLAAGGVAVFLGAVAWMLRHPRPAAANLPRPPWDARHALVACVHLGLAAALGLAIALRGDAGFSVRALPVYGALALVGFLAQLVAGVAMRILPLHAWMRSYGGRMWSTPPPSPYAGVVARWQAVSLALWGAGVPLLAAGLGAQSGAILRAGALALLAAVALSAAQAVRSLRPLWRP